MQMDSNELSGGLSILSPNEPASTLSSYTQKSLQTPEGPAYKSQGEQPRQGNSTRVHGHLETLRWNWPFKIRRAHPLFLSLKIFEQ